MGARLIAGWFDTVAPLAWSFWIRHIRVLASYVPISYAGAAIVEFSLFFVRDGDSNSSVALLRGL